MKLKFDCKYGLGERLKSDFGMVAVDSSYIEKRNVPAALRVGLNSFNPGLKIRGYKMIRAYGSLVRSSKMNNSICNDDIQRRLGMVYIQDNNISSSAVDSAVQRLGKNFQGWD